MSLGKLVSFEWGNKFYFLRQYQANIIITFLPNDFFFFRNIIPHISAKDLLSLFIIIFLVEFILLENYVAVLHYPEYLITH